MLAAVFLHFSTAHAGGLSCPQAQNQTKQDSFLQKTKVEDILPASIRSLDGADVFQVQLKNGSKKVIRFDDPTVIKYEKFASDFFKQFSTIKTSAVKVHNQHEVAELVEMVRVIDPDRVDFMLTKFPEKFSAVSMTEFHEGMLGIEYLESRAHGWSSGKLSPQQRDKIVERMVVGAGFAIVPEKIQAQLADYFFSAVVLGILDPHPRNWLMHQGQVIAIDLAAMDTSARPAEDAKTVLDFDFVQTPFSSGHVSPKLMDHMIRMISPEQIEKFRGIKGSQIYKQMREVGLNPSQEDVQKILDRVQEVLRRRG